MKKQSLFQRIIVIMQYSESELRIIELKERVNRSVEELIQALIEIDESGEDAEINNVSIDDGNGGRITLSQKKDLLKRSVMTITTSHLKLEYLIDD